MIALVSSMRKVIYVLEPPPGFEPGTSALPGRRSTGLSYGGSLLSILDFWEQLKKCYPEIAMYSVKPRCLHVSIWLRGGARPPHPPAVYAGVSGVLHVILRVTGRNILVPPGGFEPPTSRCLSRALQPGALPAELRRHAPLSSW